MKRKLFGAVLFLMIAIFSGLSFGTAKAAEVSYPISDIERIYINCDTEMDKLTKDSYVSAEITVVEKDGTVNVQDLEAEVKLRGNSTSKAEKKPVNIKLSSKQSILGMEKGKKWCILANAFDKTLIRNALCFDLADKMGLSYISQRRFVDLYFNNVYKGSYLITEPVDPGSNLVDIEEEGDDFMLEVERERNEEGVTYLETKSKVRFAINVPEEPTANQLSAIKTKVDEIEKALNTFSYSEYSKYIDVDSFVNFYIVSEIFKAVDFNYSSTRFYMKDGKLYAGPVWDVDLSSGNASPRFYTGYYTDGVSYKELFCTELKWYNYLFMSDEFVALVNARFKEMLPTVQNMYATNSLGTNMIDKLMADYKPSFLRNYDSVENGGAGWSVTYRYSLCDNSTGLEFDPHPTTYDANVEMLRAWLNNRVEYLEDEWSSLNKKIRKAIFMDGDKVVSSQTLYHGSSAIAPTLEKEGYTLSWDKSFDYVTQDIVVNAVWTINKYKVTFMDGNTVLDEQTINYGYTASGPSIQKKGYVLSWDKDFSVVKGDIVVNAIWTPVDNTPTTEETTTVQKLDEVKEQVLDKVKGLKLYKVKLKSVKNLKGKKAKLSWKKVKGSSGYEIRYGLNKKVTKRAKVVKVKKANVTTKTIKKLKKSKKYYFKVRAYAVVEGKKIYGKWSKVKNVKIKK